MEWKNGLEMIPPGSVLRPLSCWRIMAFFVDRVAMSCVVYLVLSIANSMLLQLQQLASSLSKNDDFECMR